MIRPTFFYIFHDSNQINQIQSISIWRSNILQWWYRKSFSDEATVGHIYLITIPWAVYTWLFLFVCFLNLYDFCPLFLCLFKSGHKDQLTFGYGFRFLSPNLISQLILSLLFLCLFQSGPNTKQELFTLGLGFLYPCLSAEPTTAPTIFRQPTKFFGPKYFLPKIFCALIFLLVYYTRVCLPNQPLHQQYSVNPPNILSPNIFYPKYFAPKFFWLVCNTHVCLPYQPLHQRYSVNYQIFWAQIFFTQNILGPNFFHLLNQPMHQRYSAKPPRHSKIRIFVKKSSLWHLWN